MPFEKDVTGSGRFIPCIPYQADPRKKEDSAETARKYDGFHILQIGAAI
jgi:hypothetical protein